MEFAYKAARIFTGSEWLEDHAVLLYNGVIQKIQPAAELRDGTPCRDLGEHILVPGFIDVQVYGAAGRLLSVYPEPRTLEAMYDSFIRSGTILCQPTVATNTPNVVTACIDAIRAYWKEGGKGIHGIHLEGPWINPEKRGAHVEEWIHPPGLEEVRDLLEYGKEVITMITIAPEVCSDAVLKLIRQYNIVLSAGHSNASYAQAMDSFDKGIPTITHLYNAMSSLQHRAPGMVGAALNHATVRASIIPDGHHVDFPAIAIAKKIMGERLFAITDAVTETTTGPYQHRFSGDKYESNGILSGSAISMHQAFLNLVHQVQVPVEEALRMCSLYPAQVLQIEHQYGKIAPQCAGQFVVLNKQFEVVDVII